MPLGYLPSTCVPDFPSKPVVNFGDGADSLGQLAQAAAMSPGAEPKDTK